MLEIGISTNNECGNSFYEICCNIKKAGFTNIMLAFNGDEENKILEAKKMGFKIAYVHLNYKYASDLWTIGENNKICVEDAIRQIKLCSKYNIPIAVFHGTSGNASILSMPPTKHALDCMNKILKVAEECNVKIALENLDMPNFEHFTFLLDNINSQWLGLCYDAGHHYLYKPEFDILGKYGDRILAIHLHDNLMDYKFLYDYSRDLHLLPFDGKIDFEKVCKQLASTNYNNVIMLELHKSVTPLIKNYKNMNVDTYLTLAKERAIKLSNMVEKYRNNKS